MGSLNEVKKLNIYVSLLRTWRYIVTGRSWGSTGDKKIETKIKREQVVP